jgi:para-nitrobenzyl esterase
VFGYGLGVLGALGGRRVLRAVSDRVQAHWLSVARTGAPLPSWPPYGDARTTLVIDAVDRLEDDSRRDRRLAWQGYRDR